MTYNGWGSKFEVIHRKWAGEIFHIPYVKKTGIDLVDEEIGVEVKCRLWKWDNSYTIHEYQVGGFEEDNPNKELYWMFIRYDMSKDFDKIKKKDKLEDLITKRTVVALEWDWIKQFPVSYPKTGPYRLGAKGKNFPIETLREYIIGTNSIYLPKNSLIEEKLTSPEMIKKYLERINQKDEDAPFKTGNNLLVIKCILEKIICKRFYPLVEKI